MKLGAVVPTPGEFAHETLLLLGSAILAAFIVGQLPALRDWIKRQYGAAPQPIPTVNTL